ncbi:MAG: lipoate--protein ligase family protein [Candidatus Zapsychrus exili]|nr:lipoate--protein ligase family protein [Candidatus Zapsychrus exili]
MILKDISFNSPEENILFDEVLFHLAENENTGEVLRFWESKEPFVVLGRISKETEDIKIDNVLEDKIPVLKRCSGGGTVLQGRGCFNYSLILSKKINPKLSDIGKSYNFILGKVTRALDKLGLESAFMPISDIALKSNSKKISGNAQKRGREFILHHGTILYGFDLNKIEKYLEAPKDMPDYRKGRHHRDFVSNADISLIDLKNNLKKEFRVYEQGNFLTKSESNLLKKFVEEKEVVINLEELMAV